MKRIVALISLVLCLCLAFSGCSSVTSILGGGDASIKYEIVDGEAIVSLGK